MAKKFLPKEKSTSRYQKIVNETNFNGPISNDCQRIYNSFIINSVGDVLPCASDSYNKYILGNISKQTIKEIWNGKRFRNFRKKVLTDQKNIDICQKCPYSRDFKPKNIFLNKKLDKI